jgi:hypothetical protein
LTSACPAATLSFLASPVPALPGDTVSVEIHIAGTIAMAPPSVGSFNFILGFDPLLLVPVDVEFATYLGDPLLLEALTSWSASADTIELAEVSLLSPAGLDLLQPDAFLLATLRFEALGAGVPGVLGAYGIVDDAYGGKLLAIPEPGSAPLAGLALTLLCHARSVRRCARRRCAATVASCGCRPPFR